MPKYRGRMVDAEQFTGDLPALLAGRKVKLSYDTEKKLDIAAWTRSGGDLIWIYAGDWVVRDWRGQVDVYTDKGFRIDYEPVEA